MRSMRAVAAVAAFWLLGAGSARADGFITPFIGFNFGGDSANCVSFRNCNERRLNWGASLGTTHGILGFEEDIGYAPSFFGATSEGDSAILTLMSNFMVLIPAGPIQPYGIAGLGLVRPHIKFNAPSLDLSKNALGYDIGGGLNVFVAHSVGFRGDLRHIHTLQDVTLSVFSGERLDFWRASLGLALRF